MKRTIHKGFTVLELLIVIAIMCILIGLILVGLNSARSHSRDQNKVTGVQNVVIGLSQFHDACRSYPVTLDPADPTATCASLGNKTIADFILNLDTYHFNQTGSDYVYSGLTSASNNPLDCTNFHIGVKLEGDASSFSSSKSSFDLTAYNTDPSNAQRMLTVCGNGVPADLVSGTDPIVFDIER